MPLYTTTGHLTSFLAKVLVNTAISCPVTSALAAGAPPGFVLCALVLRFRNNVMVMQPPLGSYIGHLRGPGGVPRSLLTTLSVWCGQTSTEKVWDFGWTVLRRRRAGAESLPNRQSHWGSIPSGG